jgi:hypothetical protein
MRDRRPWMNIGPDQTWCGEFLTSSLCRPRRGSGGFWGACPPQAHAWGNFRPPSGLRRRPPNSGTTLRAPDVPCGLWNSGDGLDMRGRGGRRIRCIRGTERASLPPRLRGCERNRERDFMLLFPRIDPLTAGAAARLPPGSGLTGRDWNRSSPHFPGLGSEDRTTSGSGPGRRSGVGRGWRGVFRTGERS